MSGVFEIASIVLRYPDDAVLAGREEVAREAEALPDSEATAALRRVTAWWAALADADLRREYSATFDLSRRTPLDLTYLTHGDRRQRGMALLELRQRYLALGFEPPADELPDHLPALLELASEDPEGGAAILVDYRPILELLRLALARSASPWADALTAVVATLPALTDGERDMVLRLAKEGPPTEAVGLEPFAPPESMPPPRRSTRAPACAGTAIGGDR
jgi:nitrate reductase delta subunit